MSERLQVGDIHGVYLITEVDAVGPLPAGVIRAGEPNAGIRVILTSPFADGRQWDGRREDQ